MAALEDELQSFHPAARDIEPRPKYSTALKTAIVREQLNIRKWVYGRKFKEGCLDSATNDGNPEKLANLKKTLRTILKEEAKHPPVKKPPPMRPEYELGPNSTPFRRSLDAERNHKTRELEAEFVKRHPGSIFTGETPLYSPLRSFISNLSYGSSFHLFVQGISAYMIMAKGSQRTPMPLLETLLKRYSMTASLTKVWWKGTTPKEIGGILCTTTMIMRSSTSDSCAS